MKAIVVGKFGGPEELQLQDVPDPIPQKGEALVRIEACGVNFIDIYHRTGLYPMPLPFTPGSEAAGVVEAVGPDVTEVKPGDRVACAMAPGAYAEKQNVPVWKLVSIPEFLSTQNAAAAMLQGMTVHYLAKGSYTVKPGDRVLIHAAAGGVGALLVRAAKHLGAFVIGTVSNEQKAAIAREAGADHVILYTKEDFAAETKRITDGAGVHVVYDSVGQTTFDRSLDCLRPRGILVLFGQSSGPVPPFDPGILAKKGSLFLTRPTLAHYTPNRQELLERSGELFEWIRAGVLKIRIDHTFPLAQAGEAHRRLESRDSAGKILLLP
jgi:NADPH2:quinone reductase